MENTNRKNQLGIKLQTVRVSQSFSIEELAEKSHLPLDLVKRIEAGELIPSLAPLLKITRTLGVRLETLLDDAENVGPVVHRVNDENEVVHFSGEQCSVDKPQLDFFALAHNKADRHMEPFIIKVHPLPAGAHALSTHEGEEFMYVLEGRLEIFYGKETYSLGPGDSIYLDSVVPHNVHSASGVETRILALIYDPQ